MPSNAKRASDSENEKEVISIQNMWAGYDGEAVLQDITHSVKERDLIGLIGPNGSGKTTLFKVLLGLLPPTRGEVRILDQPVKQGRRHVGYVPQLATFDRDFPIRVREVVQMGRLGKRRLLQPFTREDEQIVEQALRNVGIETLRDQPIGALVSVACGVIGTFVVVKHIVFVSGGIAHAAYGGIGLGYYFRYHILPLLTGTGQMDARPGPYPLIGAIIFSLIAALVMGWVQRKTNERADTIIGVMWAIGMALGIIFVDLTAGYKADLMSYLFGSILTVPASELWIMLALDLVILALAILFYKELLAVSFDETFAIVENVPVNAIYGMLLSLIALTVVMMMRVVGLIMVIALLTIPAAISGQFVRDMKKMMIISSLLGVAFSAAGLLISYTWNLTSGASIILVAGVGYLLGLGLKSIRWLNGG